MCNSAQVARFAVQSRVCIWLLSLLFSEIIQPYDTSSQLNSETSFSSVKSPLNDVDGVVKRMLGHFAQWDGVYYMRIAEYGYEYEQCHAFFPLLPLLARLISTTLFWPFLHFQILEYSTSLLLASFLLNNVCFVISALILYHLSRQVLKSKSLALLSAKAFCWNPSSIFMMATYSESLSSTLSFSGMYFLELYKKKKQSSHVIFCALCFGIGSLNRSNGNLLSLFIAYARWMDCPSVFPFRRFVSHFSFTVVLGVIAMLPQIVYFVSIIAVYCPSWGLDLALSSPVIPSEDRPWCASSFPNIFQVYMFIQSNYWNVGAFKYYEWKQLPNFLLAFPIIFISLYTIGNFYYFGKSKHSILSNQVVSSQRIQPYLTHWTFLTLNGIVVVHIQVITRLLSSCPPLYWVYACLLQSPSLQKHKSGHHPFKMEWKPRLLVTYFVVYNLVGTAMFCNFFPWT